MVAQGPHLDLKIVVGAVMPTPGPPAIDGHGEVVDLQPRLHIEIHLPEDVQEYGGRHEGGIPALNALADRQQQVDNGQDDGRQLQQ